MKQTKEVSLQKFKIENEETIEFELISTSNGLEDEIDARITKLDERLQNLNTEIERLTSHILTADIFVSVASGILTGIIDILYVGKLNIDIANGAAFEFRSKGAESVNRFIMDFAKDNGWNGSKSSESKSGLASAIGHLEKKFKVAQDDYRGYSSAILHHLEDLAHHPTPIGLMSALLVAFFKVGIFSDTEGTLKLMPIKTSKKDLLITWSPIIISALLYWISCWASRKYNNKELSEMPKWQRVLIKAFCGSPIFIAIGKVAINWAGHLVSDMGGSKNSPDGGAGIPGLYISLLKELSIAPPLNSSSLPKDISDLYSKKHTDFRSELLPMQESLGKQIIPVMLNELIVSTFYFVSRLKQQYDKTGCWNGILWRETIPYRNRTIARMRTIASGVFTAIDIAEAAVQGCIMSGGNYAAGIMQFALRVNIVGLGKFTVNMGNDVAMGLRCGKMRNIRINVMAECLFLFHAKLFILENETWIAAMESERSVNELQQNTEKAVVVTSQIIHETCSDFEDCKTNIRELSHTDSTITSEISALL